MVRLVIEKIVKHGYKVLLLALWIFLIVDISIRVMFFPAEVIAMYDYFFIIAFPMIYYIAKGRKDKIVTKGAMLGVAVSLISKFGFMAGSMLIWR